MKDIWRKPGSMSEEDWAIRKAEIEHGPVDRSWSVRWGVLAFILGAATFTVLAAPHIKAFFRWTDSLIGSLLGL